MNNTYITLSSNDTNFNTVLPELSVLDVTTLYVDLSSVSEKSLPLFLHVDWGDGNSLSVENDIFLKKTTTFNRYTSFFYDEYSNMYYPSDTSLSQRLTAVYTIKYCDNDISKFTIPILITNDTYENTVDDVYLVNTVVETDRKIHQLVSKKEGHLIELETPFN